MASAVRSPYRKITIMNPRLLTLTAALALSISSGAMAQIASGPTADRTAARSIAASAVGHWLYDQQGNKIGSVRSLTDGGRTAVIMVGTYFEPGSREVRVPASTLSIVHGQVMLRPETVAALNAPTQR